MTISRSVKRALYVFLILFLSSCDNTNLGNGYYYLPPDEALDIGYPYGSIIYKSNLKNVFKKIIVPANVVKCDFDADHVFIIQKLDKQLMRKYLHDELRYHSSDSIFRNASFLNRLFKNDTNYFIIDKSNNFIDGPMDKNEFDTKRKQF